MYLCRVEDISEKYNTKKRTPIKAVGRDREDAKEKQRKGTETAKLNKREREKEMMG